MLLLFKDKPFDYVVYVHMPKYFLTAVALLQSNDYDAVEHRRGREWREFYPYAC
jgi:hypothetical protein